ncbi:MAG: adenine-specific DNA-methyltransferase [Pseudonocardiales bacterium]|nr:adenine-specific DNA-methyltransferase [Pseudonocardiales bacterium]
MTATGAAAGSRKRHGVHYTPPELAGFLADRAVRALGAPGERLIRVLDPACGDGALLAAAGERLRAAGHHRVELVGADRDPVAVAAAGRRLAELGCPGALHVRDALTAAPHNGATPPGDYQLVITNPPYVRTQVLGAVTAAELSRRFGLSGRVDLMHVFVALAAEQLAEGGVLGLLCSNRFLSTLAGANVRRLLTDRFQVREVYDLGDSKPFPAAVLPAIVVGTAGPGDPDPPPARFVSTYQRTEPTEPAAEPAAESAERPDRFYADLRAAADTVTRRAGRTFAVSVGTLRVEAGPEHRWRLESVPNTRWVERVRGATWRTFGEVARIRVGIKSTADPVFVRDDWHLLPAAHRPEDELLLPLLTHRNVRAWRGPGEPATRVLYPYDRRHATRRLLELADYPRATAYLELHRDRLSARRYLADAGREWFELWVPQRPAGWQAPKIVFPDISVAPRFSVDHSGAVVNGDCYWISLAELPHEDLGYLLVGVANSTLAVRFYDLMCANRLYSGRRRWMTQYVNRLPLPDPESRLAAEVIAYARKLCETAEEPEPALVRHLDELVRNAFLGDLPTEALTIQQ